MYIETAVAISFNKIKIQNIGSVLNAGRSQRGCRVDNLFQYCKKTINYKICIAVRVKTVAVIILRSPLQVITVTGFWEIFYLIPDGELFLTDLRW